MVRAKMKLNHIARGLVGVTAEFGAVYEGSQELQKMSENAIFGDATPSGQLTLAGNVDGLVLGEEYYVDLISGNAVAPNDTSFTGSVIKVFRSEPRNPAESCSVDQFRFNAANGDVAIALYMSIRNEAASAYLDDAQRFAIIIRPARGRESAGAIEIREKLLADARKNRETARPDSLEAVDRYIADLEKKLARAKGEA